MVIEMRRREVIAILGGMMTAPRTLRAQQKPIPVIGWLDAARRCLSRSVFGRVS